MFIRLFGRRDSAIPALERRIEPQGTPDLVFVSSSVLGAGGL